MDAITSKMLSVFDDLSDTEKTNRLVDEFYAREAVFEDPVQTVQGVRGIKKMMAAMAKMFEDVDIHILDEVRNEDTLCIRWEMMFKFRYWPFEVNLPGVSWLELDHTGKCLRHTDYWDMLAFIRQTVPFAKPFERLLPPPIKKMLV